MGKMRSQGNQENVNGNAGARLIVGMYIRTVHISGLSCTESVSYPGSESGPRTLEDLVAWSELVNEKQGLG
jgi:hypothetical protein